MKKFISLALSLAIAAVAFAGCSKSPGKDSSSTGSAGGKQELTTITMPTYRAGEDVGAKFFLPQVERFNKEYEGVYKIVIEESPSNTHGDRIKQLALQDKLPAVFQMSDSKWVEEYLIANKKLQDISGFMDDNPDMAKRFIEDSVDFVTKSDGMYALPLSVLKPTGIYYNSSLFKPSKALTEMTWDEFAKELGKNQIAFQTAEGGWTIELILTGILGGIEGGPELLKAGVENKIVDFNKPQFIEAFTILQKLFKSNGWQGAIGATYPDAANTFYGNKTALLPDGTWIIDKVNDPTDWSGGFDGKNVVGDYYPGNVAIANPMVYDWMVPANLPENELKLAYAFLEFISRPEEIEAFILAEGGTAPNITYTDSFKSSIAEKKLLNDFATKANADTKYVPYFDNAIAASLFTGDFTNFMTNLYNGSWTPEKFCQELSKSAAQQ